MSRDERIDEYLRRLSPPKRALLQSLRKSIHAIVPDVEECMSYGIPAFRFGGRVIAGFAATSSGCSYYPFSGRTLTTLAADVDGYRRTKSALHCGADASLHTSLVRKLLKARISEQRRR